MAETPETLQPGTADGEIADALARIVMLTYGPMQKGEGNYWCYVALKPTLYDQFMKETRAGKMELQRFEELGYGEVIVSGPGVLPPNDVTARVAKMYNADIRELFGRTNPKTVIAAKIEQLKKDAEGQ